MWREVHSYREASGLVRCIYSFVNGRRVLGIWFAQLFCSQDEEFRVATEAQVDSWLAGGSSFYVMSVTEEEWRTAPERSGSYVTKLRILLS